MLIGKYDTAARDVNGTRKFREPFFTSLNNYSEALHSQMQLIQHKMVKVSTVSRVSRVKFRLVGLGIGDKG